MALAIATPAYYGSQKAMATVSEPI